MPTMAGSVSAPSGAQASLVVKLLLDKVDAKSVNAPRLRYELRRAVASSTAPPLAISKVAVGDLRMGDGGALNLDLAALFDTEAPAKVFGGKIAGDASAVFLNVAAPHVRLLLSNDVRRLKVVDVKLNSKSTTGVVAKKSASKENGFPTWAGVITAVGAFVTIGAATACVVRKPPAEPSPPPRDFTNPL
ncbi:hypothetical protein PPROV_001117000 [Pycnococcus provasolii]|uniref:Uncharacterized protein n=1 Tax=Pycnococcus provasolii TaxID=41880 RepID=A0A830HYW8_9CHLO|nr:hypothetical protein PPROV_001117000 [Pycnococcus provasolii]